MLLLVSGATKTVNKYAYHKNLGCLLTPDTGNKVPTNLPWAADNAAFTGFNEERFMKMLNRIKGTKPLFVSCPDVVADYSKTNELFKQWEPIIHAYGYPVAYVLQDGCSNLEWDKFEAVFIGGSTEYKLGKEAREIVREAKIRGKWVHMGRVNTQQRIVYAKEIGCDSIDGTGFSMFSQTHIPWALSVLENDQITLFDWEVL